MTVLSFWDTYLRLGGFAYTAVAIYLVFQSMDGVRGWMKKTDAPLAIKILGFIFGTAVYFFTWPIWLIGGTLADQKAKDGKVE